MNAPTFTKTGTKAAVAAALDKDVFGVVIPNHDILKQAYLASLANRRSAAAKTKTRGLVRGGGIKPWAQKGTGRARVGSSRSPIWRSGGIIFGPTGNQNYSHYITSAAKQLALRQALSMAQTAKKVVVLESIDNKTGKTSELAALIAKVGATGRVVLVTTGEDNVSLARAARNLVNVGLVTASRLSARVVLDADVVIFSHDAVKAVQTRLVQKAKEAKS